MVEEENTQRRGRTRTSLAWALRVGLPVLFVGVTVWNVTRLVGGGVPDRRPGDAATTTTTTDPGPAREVHVAVSGDIGSEAEGRATLTAMAATRPDLHIVLGDFSYAGPESAPEWCDLVRSHVGPAVPVQIVAGNHEEDTGEDGFIRDFEACLPDRMGSVGRYGREYYFDIGDLARVVMISPDLTLDGVHHFYGEGNEHIRWLEAAIDDARAQGIRWVVVGMHKNCISVGEYYCDVYQELFDLLVEKRVDLVISGHDHTYQRSKQVAVGDGCAQVVIEGYDPDCVVDDGRDGAYRQGAGAVFVIAGAGGGELYEVADDDPEAEYFASVMGAYQDPRHGFLELMVSESQLTGRFVGSTPGSYGDSFTFAGRGR